MLWSSGHHYHSLTHSLISISQLRLSLSTMTRALASQYSLSLERVTNSVTQQLGPSITLFLSHLHWTTQTYILLFFPSHLSTSLSFFFVPHTTFYYYSMPCYLIAITYSLITYYGSGFYILNKQTKTLVDLIKWVLLGY